MSRTKLGRETTPAVESGDNDPPDVIPPTNDEKRVPMVHIDFHFTIMPRRQFYGFCLCTRFCLRHPCSICEVQSLTGTIRELRLESN